jgi:hypothetical protein
VWRSDSWAGYHGDHSGSDLEAARGTGDAKAGGTDSRPVRYVDWSRESLTVEKQVEGLPKRVVQVTTPGQQQRWRAPCALLSARPRRLYFNHIAVAPHYKGTKPKSKTM